MQVLDSRRSVLDGQWGSLQWFDVVTDVLIQGSESRLKCQNVVLDCFSHLRDRWERWVDDRLRRVGGGVHR